MKCPECGGVGRIHYGEEWCSACNGTGEIEVTNEEWLRSATTEELAEFIRKQRDDWSDGWYSDCHRFEEIVEWLKQQHTNE